MAELSLARRIRTMKSLDWGRPAYRYTRRLLNASIGRDHLIRVDVNVPKRKLGNDWADWVIATRLLDSAAIVYSVGLGRDISFDLEVIAQFGCQVFGFDPTPISQEYLRTISLPASMKTYPYGLATYDGKKNFGAPATGDVSFSSTTGGEDGLNLSVLKLSSMMTMLGHRRIDVLKLDIEGDEFDCIEQIIDEGIIPSQLFVEFHHGYYGIPLKKTRESIAKLQAVGYRIFDVSPLGREFSFVHLSALARAQA